MKKILLKTLILGGIIFSLQKSNAQNLLIDGNFSTTASITPYYTDPPPVNMWLSWANYYGTGASFTTSVQNGVCSYFIDNPGTNMYDVQLTQYGFPLILNHRYRLSFDVRADADRDFGVFIGEYGFFSGSWTNLNPSYVRHATPEWQTITIDLDATAVFALHKLSFEMGIQKINMYFANISLIDLGPIPLDKVVIAGTFQSELGCPGDWLPDCDNTALTYNSPTGLWSGTFNIPVGCHQYKVTINGSWNVNYGENGIQGGANIYLSVPEETSITFTFDPTTHIVTTSPIASGFSTSCLPQVVLTGSFQSALGCSNWDANCLNTALIYSTTSGKFENEFNIPAGYYEYRITLNGDWAGGSFGMGGLPNANNYSINICEPARFHFSYDPITHIVTTTNLDVHTVVIAGSFQSEVGCSGDWQPDCDNTRLHYNAASAEWFSDTLSIPAGHWEYKVTLNNSWDINYGAYGIHNGDNISLDLCAPSRVVFTYSECDHYVYTNTFPDPNASVVIAGSFQSELGCGSDWQPDCNSTRMAYSLAYGGWVDTLLIPAGHWEYKFALNNSWDVNFGLYGERNGPAISLDLCYPAKVVFTFHLYGCYGYGSASIITNGVCVNKFYDANVNGYPNPGEEAIDGVTFTLTGNGITQTQTTGSDGKVAFTNLPDGIYVVKENVPTGYYSSGIDSQYVYVFGGNQTLYFGNVCLGAGGAKGIGFWTSKNGESALTNSGKMDEALWNLRNFALRNADGTDFDPYTYAQLKTWMMSANAKNMTYMLSAQLAAMFLNTELGYVNGYNSYIYTPGCAWWGNFMNLSNLIYYTNYYLSNNTTVDGKNPERTYLECLKNAFDDANNNLTFVQPHPCSGVTTNTITKRVDETTNEISLLAEARIWPNPSNNYFTIRPANGNTEVVVLKVYDANGQQVYITKGFANKDYRFGEKLTPGIYMVELIQGDTKTTFKVVKQ